MADYLGDKTPRFKGKLSFNPLDHIDPIGFLMIILVGFGWSKPTETNPSAYKRGYKDSYKVAIAPIIAMLFTGFLASFIFIALMRFGLGLGFIGETFHSIIVSVIYGIMSVNISLSVFNLIPMPGLAGFEILKAVKPKFIYEYGDYFYRYQTLFLIAIIFAGRGILGTISQFIMSVFLNIAGMIFF